MSIKKYASLALAIAIIAGVAGTLPAFADTGTTGTATTQPGIHRMGGWGSKMGMRPAVVGTVSAVNGTTLTVTSMPRPNPNSNSNLGTGTTYTVDASNATVVKDNATSSVSNIATGDRVLVQGAVSGTNVTATIIRDGQFGGRGMMNSGGALAQLQGNGQPIIAGTIAGIQGSTVTVTNKSNVTYTVDATNAKILQGQNNASLSNLSVGDTVIVQGTVNGTSVTASTVLDQAKPVNTTGTTSQPHPGFFGRIGQFFSHLFGF